MIAVENDEHAFVLQQDWSREASVLPLLYARRYVLFANERL
jgi:hypothetical protein